MWAFIAPMLAWIGTTFVGRFIANKLVMVAIVVLVVIPSLWNLLLYTITTLSSWALDKMELVDAPGVPVSALIEFTGIAAWLATHLRVAECIAFIGAMILTKVMLRIIGAAVPFVKIVN